MFTFRRIQLNKLLHSVLAAGLALGMAGAAAAGIKVGYVQVDKILEEAPPTSESGKKLEREFNPRTQELDRMQKQIKEQESSLDKDALTMSETDRRNRERDVQNLKIECQRKQRELREDINLRKNEELSTLQDRINKAVTSVAETEGYDMVIYSGVAYASKKVDITDKVLKILGKK